MNLKFITFGLVQVKCFGYFLSWIFYIYFSANLNNNIKNHLYLCSSRIQGPIVSSPRPHSLTVAQTPLAPQLPSPQTRDKHSGHYNSAPGKRQQLPGLSGRTQSRPVSGSLSSSNLVSVVSPPSPPKQNFQQMLRSESKQQQQQVPNRRQGMAGERQAELIKILFKSWA